MKYEEMLKKGMKQMPQIVVEKQRFEIPAAKGYLQGNKTIINNFSQITNELRRKPEHLLKFLLKELATPGEVKGGFLVLGSKVSSTKISEKLRKYTDKYVLCSECGKPDTNLEKEGDIIYLKCSACGTKYAVR